MAALRDFDREIVITQPSPRPVTIDNALSNLSKIVVPRPNYITPNPSVPKPVQPVQPVQPDLKLTPKPIVGGIVSPKPNPKVDPILEPITQNPDNPIDFTMRPNPGFPTPSGYPIGQQPVTLAPGTKITTPNNSGPNGPDATQKPDPVTQSLLDALVGAGNVAGVLGSVSPQPTVVMNPNQSSAGSTNFTPIILIGVLAVGGYFLYNRYAKGGK